MTLPRLRPRPLRPRPRGPRLLRPCLLGCAWRIATPISARLAAATAALVLVLAGPGLGPAAAHHPTGDSLQPFGVDDRYPVQVRQVVPGSRADTYLDVGDVVVEVGGVLVGTIQEFSTALREMRPDSITVRKTDGQVVQVPTEILLEIERGTLLFNGLGPGETFLTTAPTIAGTQQPAGVFVMDGATGSVLASRWQGQGRYVEVDVAFTTDASCDPCTLDTVAVMDLPSRTWLSPVPATALAAEVVPSEAFPQRTVVQPAPVLARLPVNKHAPGRIDHSYLGAAFLGQHPGVFGAYDRRGYDFAMPSIEPVLREPGDPLVAWQSGARRAIATRRRGSLVTGRLLPHRSYQGHLFYAAPPGYDGPYLVVIDGIGERRGLVRFDASGPQTRLMPLTRGQEALQQRLEPTGFVK